jgi:hypothetical protein
LPSQAGLPSIDPDALPSGRVGLAFAAAVPRKMVNEINCLKKESGKSARQHSPFAEVN